MGRNLIKYKISYFGNKFVIQNLKLYFLKLQINYSHYFHNNCSSQII